MEIKHSYNSNKRPYSTTYFYNKDKSIHKVCNGKDERFYKYDDKGNILDDGEYECKRNDVVFIRPGEAHSFRVVSDDGFEQPHIHFDVIYDSQSADIPVSFKDRDEMSQNEIIEQMMELGNVLDDMGIKPNITTSLCEKG